MQVWERDGAMESLEFTLLEFGAVGGEGGCEVHVVGDHPALGCWSPAQSVPLHPSGTSEGLPFWKTRTPISVPSGTAIQYKYLLMKDGLLHRWENFDGNRVCADVQGSSMCLLEDELDKLSRRGYPTSGGSRNSSRPGSRASNSTGALSSSGARHSSGGLSYSGDSYSAVSDRGESSTAEGAVVVVTFILPLTIERAEGGPGAEGGDWHIAWNPDAVTAKKGEHMTQSKRVLWIGCPGVEVAEEEQASLTAALLTFSCVPLYLEPELHKTFYFGFCRAFLWPTFHNVIKAQRFSQKVWRAYCTVNRYFADKVIEIYNSGDVVWVHDYHLLLLPSYILRKLRTTRVGLFLHIPFPSSEIFRTISVRDELLR